jgi:colanic acid biosynthesis glycosyl transferase WcaI
VLAPGHRETVEFAGGFAVSYVAVAGLAAGFPCKFPCSQGIGFRGGKPVIAMAEEGTGLAAEVTGAGIVIPPGDSSALEVAICQLSEAPALRQHYGDEGRKRALDRWDRRTIVRRWAEVMAGESNSTGNEESGSAGANDNVALPAEDAVRVP